MKSASYAHLLFWSLIIFFISLMVITSTALDTVTPIEPLHDDKTLVSTGGNFELGFFSPGSSTRRYVGIWFKNISVMTYVWVANRETPLLDSFGVLQMTNQSVLTLVNSTGGVVWSSNTSRSVSNPVAQLLDSGNLVVRDSKDDSLDNMLWQSFDYPCHTQLPGMKLGKNFVTGLDRFLTSWKSSDDPSPGSYTYRIDPTGYPQPFLLRDNVVQFRDGPWNGLWFSSTSRLPTFSPNEVEFVLNNREMYYVYGNFSLVTNRVLDPSGHIHRQQWINHTQGWATYFSKPDDSCDIYGACGAFSSCNLANNPQCQCMNGFVPKSVTNWNAGNWMDGCVRSAPLNCSVSHGFIKYPHVKLPDTRYSWYNTTMMLDECRGMCLQNCSCVAYANLDITNGGSGCLLWINTVIDVKVLSASGQDLYVKVPLSKLGGDKKKRLWISIRATLAVLTLMLLCGATLYILWRRRKSKANCNASSKISTNNNNEGESELPIYAFDVIAKATNDFSVYNKLGQGGFGPVYKGVLSDGREIAVKRLSKDSRQGLDEFKNEVIFIAKLQHRNLVRLTGCCVEAEERLLIYEYMPNKSLDCYIFDPTSNNLLDWPKRLEIINGIARGLLYLHQDSRLRIVHRDLKASNILLDAEMNPKISDFGLARTFNGNEDEAQTMRVVGTYGYMPPEYTIDGLFSVKSDVFSFGVLVLEIISGKKNRGFSHPDHYHSLLGHAWTLFKEGTALDLADPLIQNSSYAYQLQRSIQIGLLCVQQHPEDRPSTSLIAVMLSSDCELLEPKEPGFYIGRCLPQESRSNDCTITSLLGR
ncbi:G-type lectin S-receptor-like serine/threonine-protein kinase At4g27290 [Beta vulgaris subsp. vulgaris]|uniref:G-type lectin S-receptor-like serine/threonine-protein kinase At4g27290 n=1 Tax=Beta vulgaris subsp. vulgaris TaxID=3555 RepID=UPI002036ECA1|nr:G-type lectin S-receptor-like serine/threonine-protein kinase At4g27290 [Beta vulgaris subsp. vulgaris]